MSDSTRISVVLASYNGEKYIEAQLRSLLASLDHCDEIVMSDDGSTDGTLQAARAIGDPRLRVLNFAERLGYQRNFERAIAAAKGRYIFFSDQDDICLPERIGLSLAALAAKGCVCGDATVVDGKLEVLAPSYFAWRRAGNFSALQLFAHPDVIGATMACSRSFLMQALPFPAGVPHDQWLSVLAAWQGELAIARQPFILYRRHATVASLSGLTGRRRSVAAIVVERWRLTVALARRALRADPRSSEERLSDNHPT